MNIGSMLLGGLVLLGAVAALTNPVEEDFNGWARDRVADRSAVARNLWRDPEITRRNYVVASAYDVRILDTDVVRCYGALKSVFICTPRVDVARIPGLSDLFS